MIVKFSEDATHATMASVLAVKDRRTGERGEENQCMAGVLHRSTAHRTTARSATSDAFGVARRIGMRGARGGTSSARNGRRDGERFSRKRGAIV